MADLNQSQAASLVRRPRGAIKLNGSLFPGWIAWEVDNNSYRSADTFRIEFAASGLPAGRGPDWFAGQSSIKAEIFAVADSAADPYVPADPDRLLLGQVDDIEFDPARGTLEVSGRDLTALLIDTKTSENHQNSTSSAVATLLAQRHGLTPVVTSTATRIGQFYAIDHTDINAEQSEWDLLAKLADFEGFDFFVTGSELHFQPKPTDSGERYAIVYTPPSDDIAYPTINSTDLTLSRSLTIARGVTVEVRSWNSKQKRAFTAVWPRNVKTTKPGQAGNGNIAYHFSVPGLTQDQAYARAQALYTQIVHHMVKLQASMPGDNVLDCTKMIQVRGTGTAWDQTYYPESVRRSMSIDEGYRMFVAAKNISQDFEAAAS